MTFSETMVGFLPCGRWRRRHSRWILGRHLLLYQCGSSLVKSGGFTLDVNTLQCERVCASLPKPFHIYCNFPPSLLASPTVSSATPHADVRAEGGDVRVPELQEAEPGGVEVDVFLLAAAAQALSSLSSSATMLRRVMVGRGEGGAGAGAGHAEGAGAGGVAGEGVQGDEGPAGIRVSKGTTTAKGNKWH